MATVPGVTTCIAAESRAGGGAQAFAAESPSILIILLLALRPRHLQERRCQLSVWIGTRRVTQATRHAALLLHAVSQGIARDGASEMNRVRWCVQLGASCVRVASSSLPTPQPAPGQVGTHARTRTVPVAFSYHCDMMIANTSRAVLTVGARTELRPGACNRRTEHGFLGGLASRAADTRIGWNMKSTHKGIPAWLAQRPSIASSFDPSWCCAQARPRMLP